MNNKNDHGEGGGVEGLRGEGASLFLLDNWVVSSLLLCDNSRAAASLSRDPSERCCQERCPAACATTQRDRAQLCPVLPGLGRGNSPSIRDTGTCCALTA